MPHKLITVPSKKEKLPLSVTHPELAKEADGWDPSSLTFGSGKKVKWKCALGHVYETSVDKRTGRGHSCPFCSGHRVLSGFNDLKSTHPKIAIQAEGWNPSNYSFGSEYNALWKCPLGHTWKASIINRVKLKQGCAVCANRQIIVGVNDLQTTHPEIAAEAKGWDPTKIIAGSEVRKYWTCSLKHIWKASPVSRTRKKTGCPICVGRKLLRGFNDLATTHPELSSQAYKWDPTTVTKGSGQKKIWECNLGHTWEAVVSSRTLGANCPICSGQKVLIGFNDLTTTHPLIANQADGWDPSGVTRAANQKKKWKCDQGHNWITTVGNRTVSGHGCPTCADSGFDPNEKGFLYFISHHRWEMFQVGITNKPEKRLASHQKLGWELLEIRGPMDGHLTQQWETAILRMLKEKGADLSNKEIAGKFDGYSEAWSKSTFEVKSIKELMKMTEEFEESRDFASAKSPRPSKKSTTSKENLK